MDGGHSPESWTDVRRSGGLVDRSACPGGMSRASHRISIQPTQVRRGSGADHGSFRPSMPSKVLMRCCHALKCACKIGDLRAEEWHAIEEQDDFGRFGEMIQDAYK